MLPSQNVPGLGVSEAAALLGVHANTVRRWADDGRLPVTLADGQRRFDESELVAARSTVVIARRASPASEPPDHCAGCGEPDPRHYANGSWWCDTCEFYDLCDPMSDW